MHQRPVPFAKRGLAPRLRAISFADSPVFAAFSRISSRQSGAGAHKGRGSPRQWRLLRAHWPAKESEQCGSCAESRIFFQQSRATERKVTPPFGVRALLPIGLEHLREKAARLPVAGGHGNARDAGQSDALAHLRRTRTRLTGVLAHLRSTLARLPHILARPFDASLRLTDARAHFLKKRDRDREQSASDSISRTTPVTTTHST
jgi:hypothetical protein